ncbi:hypothetical protein PR202_gb20834 [Eleusine coracana subsp. coracana]|uniref:NAC domain-containing protein n=1 Tax=Eleusine coracana subsp. coracana TaxID=191504 RepID=A0AAV5F9I6_ELECO|nr:hypothetical protein QOZ80_7BG0599160 [Eleusine coracana subsp. coracana]GJN32334.1 hypothetical protein PR202_gb20834 [Eleusine coracana subsp. coracana]
MAVHGADDDDSFLPSNDRLVDRYLRAKIDGKFSGLAKAAYFVDADVCSARPEELVRNHGMPACVQSRDAADCKQFYFFSPARFVGTTSLKKRSRTIDGTGEMESWHAEGRPKPVEGSASGGFVTKFSYHVRIGPKITEKPGWIMAEYSFKDTGPGDTVLCKVYRSPRGPGRSKSSSSSSSTKSGCKRKAADDHEEATSCTRPRQISQEVGDANAMLFAGNLERDLQSVEHHAAVPEFTEPQIVPANVDGIMALGDLQNWLMTDVEGNGTTVQVPNGEDLDAFYMGVLFGNNEEMQNAEEIQPEPQILPASFDDITPVEVQDWMITEMVEGEDFEAFYNRFWAGSFGDIKQQDAGVPTVHAPLTDAGMIPVLATGVTVDELLLDSPSKSCLHPGGSLSAVCT